MVVKVTASRIGAIKVQAMMDEVAMNIKTTMIEIHVKIGKGIEI